MARNNSWFETDQIIKPNHVWIAVLVLLSVVLGPMLLLPYPLNLLPFVILGGTVFLYAAFRQPFVGLFIYLFIFFFRPYEQFPVPVPYEKIVAIVVLAILAVHLVVNKVHIKFDRIDWAVASVVIAAAASVPSFTYLGDNMMSFTAWFEFFKIFLVYFFTLQIATSKTKLEAIVWLFVLANVYLTGTTTYNYHTGHFRMSMGIARARGIADEGLFSHPNSVANSAVLGLPFAFYLFLHYRNLAVKMFLLGVVILSAWTVVITGSRGGMMSLFGFVLITGWRSKYRAVSLAASGIAILLVVAVMPEQYRERLLSLLNVFGHDDTGAAESAQGRVEGIVAGWKMFLMRPVTGVGIGVFGRAHYLVDGIGLEAHSLIGQLLGEVGLVGMAAFSWFIATSFRHLKNIAVAYSSRNWPSDFISATTRAVQTALILLLVQGLSGHNLFRYNWYIFVCFASIMAVIVQKRIEDEAAPPGISAIPPEQEAPEASRLPQL